ncbi:putative sodium ABC transporter, permease protein [Plesiocystis pacifica SIR-1]|uniref:Putative sodium ABC transporter, permease protein n=1 Tax=Plesiocystis pacifica SIR-1 TaxID=391625 RepID=A6FXQ8_9BACT|nr:ABC transporter permease [Plesiocystis pacifica]EDM81646.1 putative sodium ABC transporter, permease protein [Plesiocystis pacifica SIR-1]
MSWFTAMWIVLRKELVDGLRDRRALFSALLYPLLSPLLFGLLFGMIADKQREAAQVPIPVLGAEHAPELVAYLEASGATVTEAPGDLEQAKAAVREGELPFVLVIPPEFGEHIATATPAPLHMIVDGSRNDQRPASSHARQLLEWYGAKLARGRLIARGVDPAVAKPLAIQDVELASAEELALNILAFVPMFVLMATFVGGMQLAVDATAGERERGSLEPLLLNPVPRSAIVVGKWLAAVAFAVVCVVLTLLCCVLVLEHTSVSELGLSLDTRPAVLAGVIAAAFPMALMAAALQVLVASFARSFKEAQTYISLLIFVPMAPAMIGMMSGLGDSPQALLTPGVGQQILVEKLLGGQAVSPLEFVLPVVSSLVVAALCVGVTAAMFRREAVIFGR